MATTVLYHFTCSFLLPAIAKTRYLSLSKSGFISGQEKIPPVVWLTSLPTPDGMGLLFDSGIPDDLNKTHIRFTIKRKPYMKQWDKWSSEKGMDEWLKQALIDSAAAEDTYKSWYVSEKIIQLSDVLVIENLKTGVILYSKN